MDNQLDLQTVDNGRLRLRVAVIVITGIYFFVNFHRSVIPGAIFSTLQTEFNTTAVWVTALGTAFMYVYAVSQLFVGTLVDRFGGLRIILAGGVVFCLGAIGLSFCPSLGWIYVCRTLLGIGASSIYLSMVATIRRAFPDNFPSIVGVAAMIGYAGSMTATGPFVMCADNWGWRYAMGGAGIILLLIFLGLVLVTTKISFPAVNREKISFGLFWDVLKKSCNYRIFLGVAMTFGIFMVIFSFCGKKFLEDYCGMSSIHAGMVLTGMGAVSALSSFLSPLLCRLIGGKRKPFITFIGFGTFVPLCVINAALICGWSSPVLLIPMFAVITMATNLSPIYVSLLSDQNPVNKFGVAMSFSNFLAYMGVSLVGSAAGALIDVFPPEIIDGVKVYGRDSYLLLFGFFAVLAFAAICTLAGVRDIKK